MKLINFCVVLDKDSCTYEPGEEISGRVLINLEEPKVVRGLKIKIEGNCSVHWTRQSKRTEHFRGQEKYVNLTYYLLGSECGDTNVELPVGQHSHPFSIQLPYEIPSSFEHKHGYIKYTVKGVIDRPWKFDHEATTPFTVVSRFDLNTKPEAAIGIDDEDTVAFCCFCCFKVGEMDVRITVPISGYVPGQHIEVKVYFDNRSNIDIRKIKLILQQDLTFHEDWDMHTKKAEQILQQEALREPSSKRNEVTMSILVPPIPPSNLDYCKLIDMEYKLKVTLVIAGPHCNTEKIYPILIGTVPLNQVPFRLSTAQDSTEAETPNVTYPPTASYQPMPIDYQPVTQGYKLGFQNYQPEAEMMPSGGSMIPNLIGMSSTVPPPPPRPNVQQIGFVIPPELPPPSYEQCVTGSLQMNQDQDQDPSSVPIVSQPCVTPYPTHNNPYSPS